MKNNKIGKVLVVFIIAMLGFLGYLIYSKLDLSSGKYLSESEFQTIDLDDGMVVRAINTLSFPYGHKQTDLENRLFNDSERKVEDLSRDEKLLLILNDLNSISELPKQCSTNFTIFDLKYFKNSVIKDVKFIDKIKNDTKILVGPFELDYNQDSILIVNKECTDLPVEYEKLIPTKASRSNKRLIVEFKYLYIEENTAEDETIYYKSYKDNNKTTLVNNHYNKESVELSDYNTYEAIFTINDDEDIFFKEISKK